MAPSNPGQIFTHNRPAPIDARPAWPWLLALAAVLLPFDIAVRRLVISQADLRRGLERIALRVRRPVPSAPAPPPHSERVQGLLNTVERERERSRSEPGQVKGEEQPAAPVQIEEKPAPSTSRLQNTPSRASKPASSSSQGEKDPSASTAATLLEAKRKRQQRGSQHDDHLDHHP